MLMHTGCPTSGSTWWAAHTVAAGLARRGEEGTIDLRFRSHMHCGVSDPIVGRRSKHATEPNGLVRCLSVTLYDEYPRLFT
jgi:hypothetical protein